MSSTSDGWERLVGTIRELSRLVLDDPHVTDDTRRAEGMRYLTRLLAAGIPLTMEAWDPENPQLVQMLSPNVQYGLPAADCLYHWAAVRGGETYRIRGTGGSCHLLDIETREGQIGRAHV